MDKTKQTLVAALMAMLVVVAGGWFFLISPQRSNVASLNDQAQQVVSHNASLQTQINQLKAESSEVSGAQATLAAIARRLPPDPQEANLIDNLKKAADAANVDLQVITPSAPVLMAAPAAPVVTAAAPATTASGAAAAPVVHAPVAAGNQLYQIPLSLTVAGNYFDVEMFVHSLEGMQRAMVIDQLSLATGTANAATLAQATASPGAPTSAPGDNSAASPTSAAGTGKSTTHTSTSTKTGKTVKGAKPKPGTVAGAQAEIDGQTPFVPDSNTLAVTITGKVFAMYSPAAAAAVAAAAPAPAAVVPAPATPAPATTK